jgi:uncharacterized protein (DUF2062 family)
MIHLTRTLIRRWLDTLLHVNDTPERTAAAFAIGVLVGFSPFLGFHTLIAIALAFIFNLNRVAALLGVYSNLPWIIAGYYAFTTMIGAALTRTRLPPDFRERLVDLFELSLRSSEFWHQLALLLRPLLLPYMVGSLIGCCAIAIVAYPLALAFVRGRRQHLLHKNRAATRLWSQQSEADNPK